MAVSPEYSLFISIELIRAAPIENSHKAAYLKDLYFLATVVALKCPGEILLRCLSSKALTQADQLVFSPMEPGASRCERSHQPLRRTTG
jgi:hypothetical protein